MVRVACGWGGGGGGGDDDDDDDPKSRKKKWSMPDKDSENNSELRRKYLSDQLKGKGEGGGGRRWDIQHPVPIS